MCLRTHALSSDVFGRRSGRVNGTRAKGVERRHGWLGGRSSEGRKAYGRMWGETNPRATGGIKPLRGGGTLRADGVGAVSRHNDRAWCFRRKATEPHGRCLTDPMAAGSRARRAFGCAERDVATALVLSARPRAATSSDAAAVVHGTLPKSERCGADSEAWHQLRLAPTSCGGAPSGRHRVGTCAPLRGCKGPIATGHFRVDRRGSRPWGASSEATQAGRVSRRMLRASSDGRSGRWLAKRIPPASSDVDGRQRSLRASAAGPTGSSDPRGSRRGLRVPATRATRPLGLRGLVGRVNGPASQRRPRLRERTTASSLRARSEIGATLRGRTE